VPLSSALCPYSLPCARTPCLYAINPGLWHWPALACSTGPELWHRHSCLCIRVFRQPTNCWLAPGIAVNSSSILTSILAASRDAPSFPRRRKSRVDDRAKPLAHRQSRVTPWPWASMVFIGWHSHSWLCREETQGKGDAQARVPVPPQSCRPEFRNTCRSATTCTVRNVRVIDSIVCIPERGRLLKVGELFRDRVNGLLFAHEIFPLGMAPHQTA
jgi:hypothetical protein